MSGPRFSSDPKPKKVKAWIPTITYAEIKEVTKGIPGERKNPWAYILGKKKKHK